MKTPIIGIIGGKGRMGRLFADFFREQGLKVLIADRDTKLKNHELARQADITIISVPIDVTVETIEKILPHLRPDSAICDFTSVKTPAIQAMLKAECEVFGLHPMFGNSNPIPGQTVIITPTKKSGKWSDWMSQFLRGNKVKVLEMSAKEHDEMMAKVQSLIHFADIAFADTLRRAGTKTSQLFRYTSPSSELKVQLAARLIDQDPGLYANIQIANPHTLKQLKFHKKSVDELLKIVERGDINAFKKNFLQSRKFFGKYAHEAFAESSFLIDKMLALQNPPTPTPKSPGKNDLALLGPAGTFSDFAAARHAPDAPRFYAKSIDEVVDLVAKGKVKEGIIPIENKTHGTVRETLDNLFEKNVHIAAELTIDIHHCLFALPTAKKSDIKVISSHSQALAQCKKYLAKNFPKAVLNAAPSTVAALANLAPNAAAIAPAGTATSGLKILAKNIEDQSDNATTFVIVRKGPAPVKAQTAASAASVLAATSATTSALHTTSPLPAATTKTSIAFHFDKDSPGSLFTVFKDFADAGINMTKIESRPTKARFGDYIFFLDFEGSAAQPKIAQTLKKISKKVARLKLLGSY